MRLKTFELVSESLHVKNGQCVTRCKVGNETVFSSAQLMSSLCPQRVFCCSNQCLTTLVRQLIASIFEQKNRFLFVQQNAKKHALCQLFDQTTTRDSCKNECSLVP